MVEPLVFLQSNALEYVALPSAQDVYPQTRPIRHERCAGPTVSTKKRANFTKLRLLDSSAKLTSAASGETAGGFTRSFQVGSTAHNLSVEQCTIDV